MLWNSFLHIAAGIYARNLFVWSTEGIVASLIVAAIIQGIDMLRIYHYTKNRILSAPGSARERQMAHFREWGVYKLSQLYVMKVLWYGAITLAAAAITRSFMT